VTFTLAWAVAELGVESMRAQGARVSVGAYPDGVPGVRMSLAVMASKMREGRLDHRVKRWAVAQLRAAGIDGRGHETIEQQAAVLLNAFRAQVSYAPDPAASEYISSAAATLCLSPEICIGAEDCDGEVVALGSAFLSMGWPTRIIKQNFGAMQQEHVLLEVQDERGVWFPVDPSTRLEVGSSVRAVSEERIDPLSVPSASTGSAGTEIVTLGRMPDVGVPTWNGRHWWVLQPDRQWMVWYKGRWSYADPGLPLAGLGAGIITPGDVLAYRKTWDAYVLGVARAAQTCAAAWSALAQGQTPTTAPNTSLYAVAPDKTTLQLAADMQAINAESILTDWNLHADTPDWQIVVQAEEILQDFQRVVLKVAEYYAPAVARDCPGIELPAAPSLDLQAQVIGRIEGLGILAHGVLQLVTAGAGGAIETYKEIGATAKTFAEKLSDNTPWIAIAVIVVATAVAAVKVVPLLYSPKSA
jgi:hypothetical protein